MTMAPVASTKDALTQARARMEKAVEDFRKELAAIRTGRASVNLLDQIRVEYYGTPTPLNQVATLSVPDASLIVIQPWDVAQIAAVDKAIRTSDLGLNPVSDGKILRVPIPPLTEERRKELARHLHKVLENHHVAVRNIRRDGKEQIEKLLKDKKVSEDDHRKALEEMQKLTDQFIIRLDELSRAKDKEIMEIH
ncbi:MAG TPA: ribosome recycling factor [Candidatus Acidoferrales bacterium]